MLIVCLGYVFRRNLNSFPVFFEPWTCHFELPCLGAWVECSALLSMVRHWKSIFKLANEQFVVSQIFTQFVTQQPRQFDSPNFQYCWRSKFRQPTALVPSPCKPILRYCRHCLQNCLHFELFGISEQFIRNQSLFQKQKRARLSTGPENRDNDPDYFFGWVGGLLSRPLPDGTPCFVEGQPAGVFPLFDLLMVFMGLRKILKL